MTYSKLSKKEKKAINSKFVIPLDTTKVFIDATGLAFEFIGKCKVALTLKPTALVGGLFHSESVDRSNL